MEHSLGQENIVSRIEAIMQLLIQKVELSIVQLVIDRLQSEYK